MSLLEEIHKARRSGYSPHMQTHNVYPGVTWGLDIPCVKGITQNDSLVASLVIFDATLTS